MKKNKIVPRTLKGFRDFLPEDMLIRQKVIDKIKVVFENHGFLPLETPTLEHLDILSGKYGEEGEKLIFKFTDQGNRDVAMRYDLTVPLSRVVAQYNEIQKPFKRYQIQPVWRADKPQKGRFREFYQCDVDIIGTKSLMADADILSVIYHSLIAIGFKEFKIRINHRSILNSILEYTDIPSEEIFSFCRILDKLDKVEKEKLKEEFIASGFSEKNIDTVYTVLGLNSDQNQNSLSDIKKTLGTTEEGQKAIEELSALLSILESMNIKPEFYELDFTLARGLDYYTGMVFETVVEKPKIGSITGGGRYDELIGMFASEDIPAVGTSLGLERIIEVVKELNLMEVQNCVTEVMICNFEDTFNSSVTLLSQMRNNGIATELYPESKKLAKQFKYADKMGIPYVIIQGKDELDKGSLQVKNMIDGEQAIIQSSEIISYIKEKLSKK